MTKGIIWRLALVIPIAAAISWVVIDYERFEPERLVDWVGGFGIWAPVIFLLVRPVFAVMFVPGSIMAITAGILFGPVWGAVYNLVSSTAGAVLAFIIARYIASDWVAKKVGGRSKRLIDGVNEEGWRFVAFVRLVPLFPYNVLNYALGLTKIPLKQFTAATFICMIPGDIAYVWVGYASREAMAGNEAAIDLGLIGLGLLATIAFIPRLVKRYRQGRNGLSGPSTNSPESVKDTV